MDTRCGYSKCERGFLPNEDRWNVDGQACHTTQAPGQNDATVTCYWAYRHERTVARFPWPNTVFRLHWAVIVLCLLGALSVRADEPGDVRGCWATYIPTTGKFIYEPFLKIAAEKESVSEYGFPEVWGFRPWNLEPPDQEGKTHPVNILEGQFIPMGQNKEVQMYRDNGEKKKATRCPEHLW